MTLKLEGAGVRPRRVLERDLDLGPFDAVGPLSLPFGTFTVLYNDGDLRAARGVIGASPTRVAEAGLPDARRGRAAEGSRRASRRLARRSCGRARATTPSTCGRLSNV